MPQHLRGVACPICHAGPPSICHGGRGGRLSGEILFCFDYYLMSMLLRDETDDVGWLSS